MSQSGKLMGRGRALSAVFLFYVILQTSLLASPERRLSQTCAGLLRRATLAAVGALTDAEKYIYWVGPPILGVYAGASPVAGYGYIAVLYVAKNRFFTRIPITQRGVVNYLLNLNLIRHDFSGERILDVGSGYSRFGQVTDLIYRRTGTEVHSIDHALKPYGRFGERADAEALPYPGDYFDLVVSSWAYLHWHGTEVGNTWLEEMIRVAKKNGEIRLRVRRRTDSRFANEFLASHPRVLSYEYRTNFSFLYEQLLVIKVK